MEKIRWAPKIRPEKLWKLYQSDAQGALDEELLAEVGYALLARCESIHLIESSLAPCPRCSAIFPVRPSVRGEGNEIHTCPTVGCGWEITGYDYRTGIRHRELWVGGAGAAFAEFRAAYPRAKTPQERMLAIDRLIHAFHWDMKLHLPNRPAGNNLIEGSLPQVINLLDRLSFGDDPRAQAAWRETVAVMRSRRQTAMKGQGEHG